MEYKNVNGDVFSRYALTPPIINSDMANQYGIRVPWIGSPGQYSGPEVGRNAKLRLVVDHGQRKMTCHASIDWFEPDRRTGQLFVGFGHLSLSDEEFEVLSRNFADGPVRSLEFGVRVRDKGTEAESVTVSDKARLIMRMKAVDFPVTVIERIDEKRGDMSFSQFVVEAVQEFLKR